ncbi:DUF7504 family protein [Candidatus Halobonum tyrrellensis]|uniref:KaiC-like domain-containing protein n=1 Tax=Candidatus Halobonum tyrrellensis G22 TaxID=1324957 RepID=V4IZP3_9EURY|nr:hypothetical protein [Candidatus Halobonum tyrrellensis]ESP88617.1 hypothetical protein K933_07878 [Candidatus Halobonum tyrrellensis G22]
MSVHEHEAAASTEFDDASSVLLLSTAMSTEGDRACADLLLPSEADDQNALWIAYTKSPDAQVRRYRSRTDARPRNIGIISVDNGARSAAAMVGGDESSGPAGPAGTGGPTETVTNPNDLTGLGIRITEYLSEWDDTDGRTVVCFDSLTALLQYVDLGTAYEFLHVLSGRFDALGAFAHFHMDPSAHDAQTVETITSLFDAVVEVDGDERTVRAR